MQIFNLIFSINLIYVKKQPDYDDIEGSNGGIMKPMARGGKSDKGKDKQKFGKKQ